jgi:hypothetical protein
MLLNMLISCIERVGTNLEGSTVVPEPRAELIKMGHGPWAHSTSSIMCKKHTIHACISACRAGRSFENSDWTKSQI